MDDGEFSLILPIAFVMFWTLPPETYMFPIPLFNVKAGSITSSWHILHLHATKPSLAKSKHIISLDFLLLLKNHCFPLLNFFHSLCFMLDSYAHNIFKPSCTLIMIFKILQFMQFAKFYTNAFIFYLFKLENNSRSYLVMCLHLISSQDLYILTIFFFYLCKIKW